MTKQPANKAKTEGPANKLCAGCRRTCKQPAFALISSCPRYYPLHSKQQKRKEWKQPGLFGDVS